MDVTFVFAVFGLFIALLVISKKIKARKRREYLIEKYSDLQIVEKIIKGFFWQGQTSEQLTDSLGPPLDIDRKVLKTKSKEIWKYNRTGRNRYGLRVTLENDFVVGWDKKN